MISFLRKQIIYLFSFSALFVAIKTEAQTTHEMGPIVAAVEGGIIPVGIEGEAALVRYAKIAFNAHGGYQLVSPDKAAYVFEFKEQGGNQVLLSIKKGKSGQLLGQQQATGGSIENATLRACDAAVQQTSGKPGFFAGQLAFVGQQTGHREIWLSDLFFFRPRPYTTDGSDSLMPSWTASGRSFLYTSFYRTGFPDIYSINVVTGKRDVFASFNGTNTGATSSADGRSVALILSSTGNSELWMCTSEGRNFKRLTRNEGVETSPTWSPDSRYIVYASDVAGSNQLYRYDTAAEEIKRIPTRISNECVEPDWNPVKSNLVAFTAKKNRVYQIAVYDFTTGKSKLLTKGRNQKVEPCWLSDGRHLVFTQKTGQRSALWILDSETGKTTALHSPKLGNASQADFIYR